MVKNSPPDWAAGNALTERRTVHQQVLDVLRRAILSGELAAGSKLVQSEIATRLNVSTTPVREALRDLTSEGLVEFDAHRGGIVKQLTGDELDEIYEIRCVLEPLSLSLAAERITDDEIEAMEKFHKHMEAEDDLGAWVDLNRQFHNMHHEAAKSPRLTSMVNGLQDATAVFVGRTARVHPELREKALEDHAGIIDALRAGNTKKLTEVILSHIGLPRRYSADD